MCDSSRNSGASGDTGVVSAGRENEQFVGATASSAQCGPKGDESDSRIGTFKIWTGARAGSSGFSLHPSPREKGLEITVREEVRRIWHLRSD